MQTENQKQSLKWKYLLAFLLGAVLVYGLVTIIVDNRLQQLEIETRVLISEQETVLATIAETTARNGADSVTEAIIRDCNITERSRFDTLLGSLDKGLTQSELVELERLFGRCGAFYSERKSVMVARLAREFEVYEAYVDQLEILRGSELDKEYSLEDWRMLVAEEQKQSESFTRLVALQDQIIAALLEGKTSQSEEIITILDEVREVQEALFMANTQSKTVRARLTEF